MHTLLRYQPHPGCGLCVGGTGVTGLFSDSNHGQQVAIKLIGRPLSKPSMHSILGEITVSIAAVELCAIRVQHHNHRFLLLLGWFSVSGFS